MQKHPDVLRDVDTGERARIGDVTGDRDRVLADAACRSRYGTFSECQLCGGPLTPEHAHFKCRACGWRDSCCD